MVYNVEKTLKEHRDKLSEAEAKNIEESIEETKKAITAGDTEKLNAATDKLTAASHKLAEAMYKASSTPGGGASGGTGAPGTDGASGEAGGASGEKKKGDDVVDAEFVDVDDKK
jgi:molecular chaperone DnaK